MLLEKFVSPSTRVTTFFRFYKLFLKNVPVDDPVFILVTLLVDLINHIMVFKFEIQNIEMIETIISDFLFACSNYSGDGEISMSIKFHHLVHLPRQIMKFGPPRFFSTLNFEQHNHFLKRLMMTSSNWVNPAETICTKYAQEGCIVIENKPEEINKTPYIASLPQDILVQSGPDPDSFLLSGLKINGIKYTCFQSVIFLEKDNLDQLKFLYIEKIFIVDEEYFFSGQVYEGVGNDYNQITLHSLNLTSCLKYSSIESNFSSYQLYRQRGSLFIIPFHWL